MLAYKFGPNQLLRNDLDNGNHWIKVKLQGTTSNQSAIGARVVVSSGSMHLIRDVQTGSGYWSQHSLSQHFGLGDMDTIDSITVIWPSGIEQTIQSPEIDETIYIIESDSTCEEDIDNNGVVNIDDLLIAIGYWGLYGDCPADLNGDLEVDIDDVLIIVGSWGNCSK